MLDLLSKLFFHCKFLSNISCRVKLTPFDWRVQQLFISFASEIQVCTLRSSPNQQRLWLKAHVNVTQASVQVNFTLQPGFYLSLYKEILTAGTTVIGAIADYPKLHTNCKQKIRSGSNALEPYALIGNLTVLLTYQKVSPNC